MTNKSRFSKATYTILTNEKEKLVLKHKDIIKNSKMLELLDKLYNTDDIDERKNIENQILKLQKSLNLHEIKNKIDAYTDAIHKVLNQDTRKYFHQYSKKMFNLSLDIIANNMPIAAIKFNKLSADEKYNFINNFLNILTQKLKVAPINLSYIDLENPILYGQYELNTHNIYINKNAEIANNLPDVIGNLIHEFTHYLIAMHTGKSPVSKQKKPFLTTAIDIPYTQFQYERYKHSSAEAPCFYVQDYFAKHKFGEKLLWKIRKLDKRSIYNNRSK